MYGLINRAIEDLVRSTAGDETWNSVVAGAGIDNPNFVNSSYYEDSVTFDLVASASGVLETPADEILHAFGRHWVLYTGREGWGSILDMGGNDMKSFLAGLDEMHARVQVAMPEIVMPRFTLVDNGDHLCLEYRSHRDGLAPMVAGLLDGLAEQFDEGWSIEHTDTRDVNGFDVFTLREAGTRIEKLSNAA